MSSCSNSDLCIKCGACCDGTISGHVLLEDSDLKAVNLEMNLLKAGGKQVLKLPCAAHVNNTCSIYANRPAICNHYECKLLEDYKKGEVTDHHALGAIDQLKALKNEIEMLLIAAGVDSDKDDIHLKMWTLEKEALRTLSTEQFHDLHRPLLEKFQTFKKLLTDRFGVEFKAINSFSQLSQGEY